MSTTTGIHVTHCDNDLRASVIQFSGSQELFHIQSGFGEVVDYSINPQAVLPGGDYVLVFQGVNWGASGKFRIVVTTGGVDTVVESPTFNLPERFWNAEINIHV